MAKKKSKKISFRDLCAKVAPKFITKKQAVCVTEIDDKAPGENVDIHTHSGVLKWKDTKNDKHTVSVKAAGSGYFGDLILGKVNQSKDTVAWTFKLPDSQIDHLAVGQTITQTYKITVKDGAGKKATVTICVTIKGTNDAPEITSGTQSGKIKELPDGSPKENDYVHELTGAVTFLDVDTIDTHTASFVPGGDKYIGTFTIGAVDQAGDSIPWKFVVDDAVLDALGPGETLTQTYLVTVDDGHGGTASQVVTIVICGADDGVTINGIGLTGGDHTVDEDDLSDGSQAAPKDSLTQTGTFTISAPDGYGDLKIGGFTFVSGGGVVVPAPGAPPGTIATTYGLLTITSINLVTGIVGYSYTLTDSTLDHGPANDGENFVFDTISVVLTDDDPGTPSTATSSIIIKVIDDVPTAVDDDAGTIAEDAPFTYNVLANDTLGADQTTTLISATLATPGAGIITGVNANGDVTFDPAPGFAGPVVINYTIRDGDGDESAAKLTLNVAPDSVPAITVAPVNLVVDEDGLAGNNPDGSPLRPGETDSTESATGIGSVVVNFGNDVPASLLDSIKLLDTAALDNQLQTLDNQNVTFALSGGDLVGTVSGGATEVIRIKIVSAAAGPGANDVTYTYSAQLSQPVKHAAQGEDSDLLSGVTFEVTDSDGTKVQGTFGVTVVDDMPSISLSTEKTPNLAVDETDLSINDTRSFAASFTGVYGADGQGSTSYALSVIPGASGLIDTATGQPVNLDMNGTVVEGKTAGGDLVFTVSVNATTGEVTLDQLRAVKHPIPSNHDEAISLTNNLVTLTATITDGDGDTASADLPIGSALTFLDDGPTTENDVDSIQAGTVQVLNFDDVVLPGSAEAPITNYGGFTWTQTGVHKPTPPSNYVPTSGDQLAFFAEANGTDQDPLDYPLPAGTPMSASGGGPFTFLGASFVSRNVANMPITVVGYLAGGGTVTTTIFAQQGVATFFDFTAIPAFANASLVKIEFDAPDYFGFDDFTTRGVAPAATGNVITASDADNVPNNDANVTDGAADNAGADGLGSIAWTGQIGNTVQGAYGVLTVDAAGNYSYALNSNHPFIVGLDGTQSTTETFNYTITDGDGDSAPATLTITINGANDPVTISGLNVIGGELVLDEDDLPNGTSPNPSALTKAGTFTINAPDGVDTVVIGGVLVIDNGLLTGTLQVVTAIGTLTITGFDATTGEVSYEYTLDTNTTTHPAAGEDSVFETFQVDVTDTDGSMATAHLDVHIVDDVPVANVGPTLTLLETAGATAGTNLLANDAQGADGATVTHVIFGATTIAVSTGTTHTTSNGTYTFNANGSWTFDPVLNPSTANVTETFTYRITDGDGDVSEALQSVTINNANTLPTAGIQSIVIDEEGLANGLAGSNIPGDVPNEVITASGTLLFTHPDGAALVDPVSFANIHLSSVGASSGGLPLTYFWDATGDVLYASTSTASLGAAQTTAAFTIALNTSSGAYTYTQLKPLTHPIAGSEDDIDLAINYRVQDIDGEIAIGTLNVKINDDSPVAVNDTASVQESAKPTLNAILVLDLSLSMTQLPGADPDGPGGFATRLDLMKAAVDNLLSNSDVIYNNVTVYSFGVSAQFVGSFSGANGTLTAINAVYGLAGTQAGTQYDAAASLVGGNGANGYAALVANNTVTPASETILYFLSDGDPQSGNSLNGTLQTAWTDFLNAHVDEVVAVGFGGIVNQMFLQQMAPRNGVDTAISVTDPSQLSAILTASLPGSVSGNVLTDGPVDDAFGADGGQILSIQVGGNVYSYVGGNILLNGGAYAPGVGTQILSVTTGINATLGFNFLNGDWNYTPPSAGVNADTPESFLYTLRDNDGDTSSATLTVTVLDSPNAAPTPQADIIRTNWGGTFFTVPEWALLNNDTDPNNNPLDISGVSSSSGFEIDVTHNVGIGTNGFVTIDDDGDAGGSFQYAASDGSLSTNAAVTVIGNLTGTSASEIFVGNNAGTTFNGGGGFDVFLPGGGADTLNGGTSRDTYGFGLNDGTNTINDPGGTDAIKIMSNGAALTGLSFNDSNTGAGNGNLVITVATAVGSTSITVTDHFAGTNENVETITFLGGTSFGGYALGSNPYRISADDSGERTATTGENWVLVGAGDANTLAGSSGNDLLFGSGGADTLNGGSGNDLLVGGAGNDIFVFNTALNAATNVDTITDFDADPSGGQDLIHLENAIFMSLTSTGALDAANFALNAATTANHFIIFNTATGGLFYDADGSGGSATAIQFATLTLGGISGTVDASDFVVI